MICGDTSPFDKGGAGGSWAATAHVSVANVVWFDLAEKRGHHLTREAAQGGGSARAVDQHVGRANVAQRLQLDGDAVGRAS